MPELEGLEDVDWKQMHADGTHILSLLPGDWDARRVLIALLGAEKLVEMAVEKLVEADLDVT